MSLIQAFMDFQEIEDFPKNSRFPALMSFINATSS
jgi:hypothetical protein